MACGWQLEPPASMRRRGAGGRYRLFCPGQHRRKARHRRAVVARKTSRVCGRHHLEQRIAPWRGTIKQEQRSACRPGMWGRRSKKPSCCRRLSANAVAMNARLPMGLLKIRRPRYSARDAQPRTHHGVGEPPTRHQPHSTPSFCPSAPVHSPTAKVSAALPVAFAPARTMPGRSTCKWWSYLGR